MAILREASHRRNPQRRKSLFDKLELPEERDRLGLSSYFHCIGSKEIQLISIVSHAFDFIMESASESAAESVGKAMTGQPYGAESAAFFIDFVDDGDIALDKLAEGLALIQNEITIANKSGVDTDRLLKQGKFNITFNQPLLDGLSGMYGLLDLYLNSGGENFTFDLNGKMVSPHLAKMSAYKLVLFDLNPKRKC